MRINLLKFFIIFFLFLSNFGYAQISGTVFRDFNANGTKDNTITFNEPFANTIIIKAYNSLGVEVGSTTSDAAGAYAFTGLVLPLRIEFTNLSTGDFSAASGIGNNSSVQFYSAATTTANFGVNYPDDYCNNNPFFASNVYVASPGTNGTNGLAAIPYGTTGTNAPLKQVLNTPYNMIGSVWGMAHQRESNTLFSASFMKRHTAFGSGGTGAIYATTGTDRPATSATLPYIDLQTLAAITTGPNTHATDLTIDEDNANGSPYDAVGKVSLGDMDISADGKYLFVVNLFEKKLHRIFIGNPAKPAASLTAADVTSWDIPSPCDTTKGTSRPWGLAISRGKVYVGVVCDASISLSKDNLSATVYEMDPASGTFTSVLNFPLDFFRGATSGNNTLMEYWNAWRPFYYRNPATSGVSIVNPQPILSDIDFDTDGSMILAFTDRFAHQMRRDGPIKDGTGIYDPRSAGDILRAGKCSTANIWTIENNASVCGGTATAGAGNTQGPGGGEYYFGELYENHHQETAQGAVAMLRGSNQVLVSMMDPLRLYTAGFYYMNNTTGVVDGKYELVGVSGAFGKAGAIGDVEMLCIAQPIEIGNRVFFDTDRDGIQDADEAGIADVSLEIFTDFNNDGAPDSLAISTVTTNADGIWYFNNSNITDGDPTTAGNQAGLTFNKNYIIRVAGSDWANGSGAVELMGKELTISDIGGTVQADAIDSDAEIVNTIPQIRVLIGNSGENNHTLDFGFKVPCALIANTPTGTGTKCKGGSDGTSSVTISGNTSAVTYLWSNAATMANITGLVAGTYNVTVTETANCTATASYTVTEPTVIVLTCSKADATTAGGKEGTASVTATGGTSPYTYLWSDVAGSTTATISGLAAGTYTVTVTDANGCTMVCSSIVESPVKPPCNILDAGLTVTIDQKGTSSIADDEYVIFANPIGSGLSGTYNVSGTITKNNVPYGVSTEIGRVLYSLLFIDIEIADGVDPFCSIADGAFNLPGNSCLLTAGTAPYTICNDNGTPSNPIDDTYSVTINPTGVSVGTTYSVTGDIVKTGQAYGISNVIAIGLLISAGGKTISIKDDLKPNCELLNIRIDPPKSCSNTIACPARICVPVRVVRN